MPEKKVIAFGSEQERQDLIKSLAAGIVSKMSESNKNKADEGRTADENYNPVDQATIEKMVDAQLAAYNATAPDTKPIEQPPYRVSGEFDITPVNDPDKVLSKNAHGLSTARQKVFTPKSILEMEHSPDEVSRIVQFQKDSDHLLIMGSLLAKAYGIPYAQAVRSNKIYERMSARLKADRTLAKALAVANTGFGAEWIPTAFSADFVEILRLERRVMALFPSVNMPSNPWTLPVQASKASIYYVPESTEDESVKIPATGAGTGGVTFNAKKLMARLLWSGEVDEDSIIAVLDFIRQELAKALKEAEEDAVLNGDTNTTHQDSDVTSSNDHRKMFVGLRYQGLNNAGTASLSFSNAVPSVTLMRGMRALGLKYAVNPADLAYVVSVKGYIKALNISEVLTADKMPNGYTLSTGALASFDGSPLLVSEAVRDTYNASGVFDNSTVDRSVIHMIYRRGYMIGNRAAMTLKVAENDDTDQLKMIIRQRFAFEDVYNGLLAANPISVVGYNVKVT